MMLLPRGCRGANATVGLPGADDEPPPSVRGHASHTLPTLLARGCTYQRRGLAGLPRPKAALGNTRGSKVTFCDAWARRASQAGTAWNA